MAHVNGAESSPWSPIKGDTTVLDWLERLALENPNLSMIEVAALIEASRENADQTAASAPSSTPPDKPR